VGSRLVAWLDEQNQAIGTAHQGMSIAAHIERWRAI
jgi:hypothetical protein